jgi:hypothetical protein
MLKTRQKKMKEKWCKIVETEEIDILVRLDYTEEKKWELRLIFPFDGMMAETSFEIQKDKDPHEYFNSIPDEQHINYVKSLIEAILTT